LLHLGNTIGETNARLFLELESNPDNLEQIMRYIDIYCDMLERLLGARRGSIEPVDKNIVQKIVAARPK
jgi:hypothetical protein